MAVIYVSVFRLLFVSVTELFLKRSPSFRFVYFFSPREPYLFSPLVMFFAVLKHKLQQATTSDFFQGNFNFHVKFGIDKNKCLHKFTCVTRF